MNYEQLNIEERYSIGAQRGAYIKVSQIACNLDRQPLAHDALFVFTNKRRTRVKLLCFDGTGLWLATKRLEKGTFSWPPPSETGMRKITLQPEALRLLLDGVDLRGAKMRPWFQRE